MSSIWGLLEGVGAVPGVVTGPDTPPVGLEADKEFDGDEAPLGNSLIDSDFGSCCAGFEAAWDWTPLLKNCSVMLAW